MTSFTTISSEIKVAGESYLCMATTYITNCFPDYVEVLTSDELEDLYSNLGYILEGDNYLEQVIKDDDTGEAFTTRSIPEIHKMCIKYEVY